MQRPTPSALGLWRRICLACEPMSSSFSNAKMPCEEQRSRSAKSVLQLFRHADDHRRGIAKTMVQPSQICSQPDIPLIFSLAPSGESIFASVARGTRLANMGVFAHQPQAGHRTQYAKRQAQRIGAPPWPFPLEVRQVVGTAVRPRFERGRGRRGRHFLSRWANSGHLTQPH